MPDVSERIDNRSLSDSTTLSGRPEIVLGTLVGFDDTGSALIDWPENPRGAPVAALSTALYRGEEIGRTAALMFAGGDPSRPVIIGLIRKPLDEAIIASSSSETDKSADSSELYCRVDGESVVLKGNKTIVLQCGKASITLTSSGKILIRGAYVLSRSSGTNRIKGGSVQIN